MATRSQKPGRVLLRRLAWIVGAVLVVGYTVEGGEWSVRDLFTQKGKRAALEAEVTQLRHEVDSLRGEMHALKTDDAKLERIAREEFGMVRGGKELLYWVGNASKDSVADSTAVPTESR